MSELTHDPVTSLDALAAEVADEYLERKRRGEKPTIEEYIARHPEAAPIIQKVFAALEIVGVPGNALSRNEGETVQGQLGDYLILREIGRGGMGVVYEAEQISLGRRVALKVLPFAATMDKRQLQRFQNEARAAASLEHPHIVPVYGVGCERGVHYYAMRFIEGQPLDAILQQLRDEKQPAAPTPPSAPDPAAGATVAHSDRGPQAAAARRPATETVREPRGLASTLLSHGSKKETFRRIAELALQAADALEHAHQSGVIHRDIKPANLLLDDEAQLWITDFGLAQIQSDIRLTMTGDLVGTLRYMSPEQALAKRVIVDHRTDIYSLGATFYEVLTLTPVFGGQDRQELLRQIAFEEPVAPRRVNRHIPAELETVIMKAVEKNPADRYGTAKEMADDLKRYLNDEPTLARRPGMLMRARKWGRRHLAAVRAAAVALLLVVLMAAGMAGWWLNDQARREAETERAVNALLEDAEQLQKARKTSDALAKVKLASQILANGASTDSLEIAVKDRLADLQFAVDLEEIRLKLADQGKGGGLDVAHSSQTYASAFRAFGFDLEKLTSAEVTKRIKERTVCLEIALALDEWAPVAKSSAAAPSNDFWKLLLAVAREVDPDHWRCVLRDSRVNDSVEPLLSMLEAENLPPMTVGALASQLRKHKRHEEAAKVLGKAQKRDPDDFWINYMLATALWELKPPPLEDCVRFQTVAVALRRNSAHAHYILGLYLKQAGKLKEAIDAYQEAIRLQPDYPGPHNDLGVLYCDDLHKYDKAIECFKEAIRLFRDHPHPAPQVNLSVAYRKKGMLKEALVACEKALQIDAKNAASHRALGDVLSAMGQHDKAITAYKESSVLNPDDPVAYFLLGKAFDAARQWHDAAASYQQALNLKQEYAEAHNNLGNAFREMGRLEDAWKCFRNAIHYNPKLFQPYANLAGLSLKKGLVDQAIVELEIGLCLSSDLWHLHARLGNILLKEKNRADDAIRHFKKAIELKQDFALAHYGLAWLLATAADQKVRNPKEALVHAQKAVKLMPQQGEFWNTLGVARYRNDEWKEAIEALNKSMAMAKGGDSADFYFLAMSHYRLDEKEQARTWYDKGVQWMDKNRPNDPELQRFRTESAELLGIETPKAKDKKQSYEPQRPASAKFVAN